MEFAQSISPLSCCSKCRQSPLLELRHDLLSSHLVDLCFLFARHAIFLQLCLAYKSHLWLDNQSLTEFQNETQRSTLRHSFTMHVEISTLFPLSLSAFQISRHFLGFLKSSNLRLFYSVVERPPNCAPSTSEAAL